MFHAKIGYYLEIKFPLFYFYIYFVRLLLIEKYVVLTVETIEYYINLVVFFPEVLSNFSPPVRVPALAKKDEIFLLIMLNVPSIVGVQHQSFRDSPTLFRGLRSPQTR